MHRAVVLGRPDILAILMSSKRWALNQVPKPKVLKNEKSLNFYIMVHTVSKHWMRTSHGKGLPMWLECLNANAKVTTVLGSIPAFSNTVNLRGGT